MRLSIIIPVFNGERHIVDCLASLMCQWAPGVEIIVINDGSTDHTEARIQEAFAADLASGAIRYVATSNAGVSAARNLGLDMATGDYLAFVDADDMLARDYLAKVLEATDTHVDLIEIGYRTIDLEGREVAAGLHLHTRFGRHAMADIMPTVFAAALWYPVLRIGRRHLFDKVRFPVGVRFCEDLMTIPALYRQAKHLLALPDALYGYRVNPLGATLNVRADYAPNLIRFYQTIQHDESRATAALKIGVAYAARQCLSKSTDPFGRLPRTIEADLWMSMLRHPWLAKSVRPRFLVFAICGPAIFAAKRLASWVRGDSHQAAS